MTEATVDKITIALNAFSLAIWLVVVCMKEADFVAGICIGMNGTILIGKLLR